MKNQSLRTASRIALASLLGGTFLFAAGCTDRAAEEAGRKVDQAAADAKQVAKETASDAKVAAQEVASDAKAAASTAASDAKAAAGMAASDAKAVAKDTSEVAARLAKDAAITASINVDLAKDPGLSALQINVDTVNGEVTLRGEAGSNESRMRAGNLARNIAGVNRVNNQLRVRA